MMAKAHWIELIDGALPLEKLPHFVCGDAALGGIASFYGATRGENDAEHGELTRLDYEAYSEMALNQMRGLVGTAEAKWGAGRVAMLHRLGPVGVGEISVAIAVATPHRAEAFEACRWLIDSLKRDVPIWKKDVFADGFTRWVNPGRHSERSEESC
jgi:molybdopterin synthase catalytic subunit